GRGETRPQAGREGGTEIQVRDTLVEHQLAHRAGDLDLALEHDVGAVDDVEGLLDVVIGDQHPDPLVPEPGDDRLAVVPRARGDRSRAAPAGTWVPGRDRGHRA